MAQSLVLSIDVCRGLGISPLRTNIWLSFSRADLGPKSAQDFFFGVFGKFDFSLLQDFVLINKDILLEKLNSSLYERHVATAACRISGYAGCVYMHPVSY